MEIAFHRAGVHYFKIKDLEMVDMESIAVCVM